MNRACEYVFGSFVLDLLDERLWKGSDPVPLGRKALSVLAELVARPNQLVTKDQLLASVWPDIAVTEAVLTTAVREIRAAIADDARSPRFVATVYGRGYRFVCRVEERSEAAARRASEMPGASWLVGRDTESRQLEESFHDSLQWRRRVVLIAGEAGIGKTALVEAFTESVAERDVWVARGQCVDQYGAGEAYMPIVEALTRLNREGAVTQILQDNAPSWIAHLAKSASSAQPPPATSRPERMFRELAQVVEAITAVRPVVLALEDLQWCDRATLDWLAYLVRRRDPARLLILATYRPLDALLHPLPIRDVLSEVRHQSQTHELVLDYLSFEAVQQYVRRRCGNVAELDELGEMLYRRTGGLPLFLASIVDELVRGEMLERTPQDLRLAVQAIPATVRLFVEHRIEHLSAGDRTILEAASVAGDLFSIAAVSAATGCAEDQIEAQCALWAERTRILVADGTAVWPDGTISAQYRFRHALFQETAYARISPERRARMHALIGSRLETAYARDASSIAGELAMHFEQGRDPLKAVGYLELAARNAMCRSAYYEAQQLLSHARLLNQHLPESLDRLRREASLCLLLAHMLEARQGWGADEVSREYARARDLCVALHDDAPLLQATWGLIAASVVRADYQRTRAMARDLLRLAKRKEDELFRLAAHAELGGTALLLGHAARARRHFNLAEALTRRDRHPSTVVLFGMDMDIFAGTWATHLMWYVGDPDRAFHRAIEVVQAAADVDHPFTRTIALAYAGMLAQFRRDEAEVRRLAMAAIAHATEHNFPYYRAWSEVLLAWSLRGESCASAVADMRSAIGALQATAGIRLPYYRALLAEACGRAGRVDEGLQVVTQAFEDLARTDERWWEAELHRTRGELLLQRTDRRAREAESCLRTAITVARRQGARALELRSAISLMRMLRGRRGENNARAHLRRVYDSFTGGFSTVDLREAGTLLDS